MLVKFFLLSSLLVTQASAATAVAQGQEQQLVRLLSKNEIKQIIGNPPAKGSAEELKDFATLLKYQVTRTKADCDLARSFVDVSIKSLFVDNNGPLSEAEARKINLKLLVRTGKTMVNIMQAKGIYDRPRPYLANPLVKPCIEKEQSSAYPSGHAAYSRVMAHILGKIYPERAEALMERADLVAQSRVLGGVHHPSDIMAGKKLGDGMAAEFLDSEELMDALAELR